jgi:hypothetical protein
MAAPLACDTPSSLNGTPTHDALIAISAPLPPAACTRRCRKGDEIDAGLVFLYLLQVS